MESRRQLERHLGRGTGHTCAEAGEHKEGAVKTLQISGLSFLSAKERTFQWLPRGQLRFTVDFLLPVSKCPGFYRLHSPRLLPSLSLLVSITTWSVRFFRLVPGNSFSRIQIFSEGGEALVEDISSSCLCRCHCVLPFCYRPFPLSMYLLPCGISTISS